MLGLVSFDKATKEKRVDENSFVKMILNILKKMISISLFAA
jgi:hypothetical protein